MKSRILIIIGAAPCAIDDIYNAMRLIHHYPDSDESVQDNSTKASSIAPFALSECHYCAIGLDAVDLATWPIQFFATLHPGDIEPAKERREKKGGNTDYKVISFIYDTSDGDKNKIKDNKLIIEEYGHLIDIKMLFTPPSGSSAMLGVRAGIELGYKKIIICGCPLNEKSYQKFQRGWTANLDAIKEYTRSMSGWTKELLGVPSESWLSETECTESLEAG
jgi:hypothetical protein